MTSFLHKVPLDVRRIVYEYSAEPIVHYSPTLWIDTSVSSGQWLAAAKMGDLEALQALEERFDIETRSFTADQKLQLEGRWKTSYLCPILAEGGHLSCLVWAHSRNCPMDFMTWHAALEGGHTQVLKWLQQFPTLCSDEWEPGNFANTKRETEEDDIVLGANIFDRNI